MILTRADIRLALARAYVIPHNKCKPIDSDLLDDMADEVMRLVDGFLQDAAGVYVQRRLEQVGLFGHDDRAERPE